MSLVEIPVLNFQVLQSGHANIQLKDKRLGVIEVKQISQLLDLEFVTSIQEYKYSYTEIEKDKKNKEVIVTNKFCCVIIHGTEKIYTSLNKNEILKLIRCKDDEKYGKYNAMINLADNNPKPIVNEVIESDEDQDEEEIQHKPKELTHDRLVEIARSVTAEDLFN